MKRTNRHLHLLAALLLGSLLLLAACDSNGGSDDPEDPDPPENPGTPGVLSPDVLSEHLVLTNATRIDGTLFTVSDGQLQTSIEDTIYVVKGHPMGTRVLVRHDPSQDVAGHYIQITGASFYYDVPEDTVDGSYMPDLPDEDGETYSTSVLVLDLDLADRSDVTYPFTAEVTIQPHDASGTPLDAFVREITVEDPDAGGPCNSILRTQGTADKVWGWEFTIRESGGEIANVWAPGLATRINTTGGGCCRADGKSMTVTDGPPCFSGVQTDDIWWVTVEPDDYVVRTFELLWFWGDGELVGAGLERRKQYNPFITDFCAEHVGYDFFETDYGTTIPNECTHSFTPGDARISFDLTGWKGGYRIPRNAEIVYTCNTLIMSWGGEGDRFASVYRRLQRGEDPVEFDPFYTPWFD